MQLVAAIIIGFLAGALSKWLMPGKDPGGFWLTVGLGIAGAFVATVVGRALAFYRPEDSAGLIASTLGALAILLIYHMARRGNAKRWEQ